MIDTHDVKIFSLCSALASRDFIGSIENRLVYKIRSTLIRKRRVLVVTKQWSGLFVSAYLR